MKLYGDSISEGIDSLMKLRRYQPYKYSGKWHIAKFDNQIMAFRSIKTIRDKAAKLHLQSIEVTIIE